MSATVKIPTWQEAFNTPSRDRSALDRFVLAHTPGERFSLHRVFQAAFDEVWAQAYEAGRASFEPKAKPE